MITKKKYTFTERVFPTPAEMKAFLVCFLDMTRCWITVRMHTVGAVPVVIFGINITNHAHPSMLRIPNGFMLYPVSFSGKKFSTLPSALERFRWVSFREIRGVDSFASSSPITSFKSCLVKGSSTIDVGFGLYGCVKDLVGYDAGWVDYFVFTTCPETLFGALFFVMAPKDPVVLTPAPGT